MGTRTFVNDRLSFSPVKNLTRGVDIPLILTVIALLVFGLIMLYSASFDFSYKEYGSSTYMFQRQVRWVLLGITIVFVLSLFDYHNWRKVVVFAMLATIALLATVLFINEIRLGASRVQRRGARIELAVDREELVVARGRRRKRRVVGADARHALRGLQQ